MKTTYYRHEEYETLVRHDSGSGWFYKRADTDWIYDADLCGIMAGVYTDYRRIEDSEAKALQESWIEKKVS